MKIPFAALALACAPLTAMAQDVTVDAFGGPVTVAQSPETVVALDLAAIDTLHALGVPLDGVPNLTPPAFLASAFDGVPNVGTLFEPDFEALAVLGPDLIVAGGRSQPVVGALSELAPTLDMTIDGLDLVAEAKARTTAYGAIFDKTAEAEALNAALDAKIAQTQEAVSGKGSALILMANGGKLSAYGADSRFGWLHSVTGLPQAYADISVESHGQAVSFEFIAEVNPEWILVIDRLAAIGRAGEAAAATLDTPLLAQTTAGQRGQILYLDSAPLYLAAGGATALPHILDQLIDGFQATNGS
ncbi:siderophore ABC transporter substrate-binding protein [Tropicibacter naphthalenivorans]|uniref:Putative ABC transporter solute-binding protein YclQ n=1 Tax=Tropicibacter naphthalenivorans TaxID=441103 RepID=A0A0P1GKE3_9RHOB|nr:siderophore ABC transporter substrate-binding protein [Tropicibacter naphthalenivorans]CUH82531.1 putative ABC transporter solute-binding protein YclQ precursor [Tropicibacter naphthalenivorans]SMD10588.1 iron complex transport system substrate-binding protein [Tropicibacter naphthalenivorans]